MEKRGFSAAAGAQDAEPFAGFDVEVDAGEDFEVLASHTVGLGQLACTEYD